MRNRKRGMESMSKIPVVLDARVVTGSGGGPDKTILNSPRPLAQAGYRMLCAYLHPPSDDGFLALRCKADQCGAPLISIPDRGPWDWRVVTRLLHICRQQRVQIFHGHDYKSNLLGLLLHRSWPMRLVTTVHGWVKHTMRTPLYYGIDRLCLPYFEKVLCVSADLREQCIARGVAPERCQLLENGIDICEYVRRRPLAEAKRALGIASRRRVIGAVGRLSPEKGFDRLIYAVKPLLEQDLDIELRIIGEGDYRPRLEALIARLGLQERCRLLGFQGDLRPHYEAMDVFALSSLREGLPNVLLEALAMAVPVVATAVNGVPRLIRYGLNGLLVPPGNAEALAGALAELLRDNDLADHFRQAGRAAVQTGYNFQVRTERLKTIYDQLLYSETLAA